jgi:hypothetical protein
MTEVQLIRVSFVFIPKSAGFIRCSHYRIWEILKDIQHYPC